MNYNKRLRLNSKGHLKKYFINRGNLKIDITNYISMLYVTPIHLFKENSSQMLKFTFLNLRILTKSQNDAVCLNEDVNNSIHLDTLDGLWRTNKKISMKMERM